MYIHRNLINFPLLLSLNMYIHIAYASVSYLATFAISTDQSYRFVPCFRSWSLFVPPSVVERFYDAGLEAGGHNLQSGKKYKVRNEMLSWTSHEHLPGWCFFVGWRSWWFLYWNDGSPGNPWSFWGTHAWMVDSLREIDNSAGQGKRDCTISFRLVALGGSGSRSHSRWFERSSSRIQSTS